MKRVKTKEKPTKSMIIRRALLSLLVSVILPLMLLISVPFEVYAANHEEFIFALSEFFPVCVGFFFLATFVIYVAIFFLPKKAFRVVSAILIAFALMFFLQGNYLNGHLNTIGGDHLDGEGITTGAAVFNIVLWCVVIIAAIVLAFIKDKKNIISYVGGVLALILLITQVVAPITVAASNSDMFASASDKKDDYEHGELRYILTDKNIRTPSKEGNVYYFIIDRFDESFAEQAYRTDPDLLNGLEGFTWFQNHLASYNHTYPAVAEMLTDVSYDPEKYRMEWFKEAYDNPDPLNVLNSNGYSVNLYTEQYYSFGEVTYLPDYISNISVSDTYEVRSRVGLAFSIVGVGLYRDFPYYLKGAIDISSSTSNEYIKEEDASGNVRYSSNHYPTMDFATRQGKGFYFIHTNGCHDSFEALSGGRQAVSNLKEINNYLGYLKEQGLYEDATIIITGDHGITEIGGFSKPSLTALFVKPSGVGTGELQISNAPTSHKNLWATIFKSENITTDKDYGPSVFEIDEHDPVERYIVNHSWAVFYAITYKVTGDARNFDNWEIVDELSLNKGLID